MRSVRLSHNISHDLWNSPIHGFTISFPFRKLHVLLLEDSIISSKANPCCSGSTKQKIWSNGKLEIMKQIQRSFSFISTLYLKQQANILCCFCSLKFENSLFSNKLFRCIFRSERKIYTAENDQKNILFKTSLLKSQDLCEGLFNHSGNCSFLIYIRQWTINTSDWTHPLNVRKGEPYKTNDF